MKFLSKSHLESGPTNESTQERNNRRKRNRSPKKERSKQDTQEECQGDSIMEGKQGPKKETY